MSYPKLALIGKNISHSKSPEIYRRLISPQIQYDLIDVQDKSNLPTIEFLSSNYVGINITAPWKVEYLKYAVMGAKKWLAVNCIRFRNGNPEATNTDATALEEIIPAMKKKYQSDAWIILGDGSMAKVVGSILTEMGENYYSHSRKLGDQLNQFDFVDKYQKYYRKILINTCSRDFIFTNKLDATWLFWDLNYAHSAHQTASLGQLWTYVDGIELLETQAQHAVKFWEL